MFVIMESNESLIDDFAENNKIPKKRGWLSTILFGKKISWKRRIMVWIICSLISCISLLLSAVILSWDSEPLKENKSNPPIQYVDKVYQDIEKNIDMIRGLSLTKIINHDFVSQEEFLDKLNAGEYLYDDDEYYHVEQITSEITGLLKKGQDYKQIYSEYADDNVVGQYDYCWDQIIVVENQNPDKYDLMTYAHEYTHALQDHNFEPFEKEPSDCASAPDECLAYNALLEGDPELVSLLWLDNTDDEEIKEEYYKYLSAIEQEPQYFFDFEPTQTPYYIQRDSYFPYIQGREFTKFLYNHGGWEAINRAYQDPPISTEQILHPGLYPSEKPLNIVLPDLSFILGSRWRKIAQFTLGEWKLLLTLTSGADLQYRLDEDTGNRAASGWGGDILQIYQNKATDKFIVIFNSVWDTKKDAEEFIKAFGLYGGLRWGQSIVNTENRFEWNNPETGYIVIYKNENEVIWIIAPRNELIKKIILQIQNFRVQAK
jgi:hypothetical protein